MKRKFRYISILLSFILLCSLVTGCKQEQKIHMPKYIFFMIGDGMGNAQVQAASYYLGALQNADTMQAVNLSFMSFPYVGNVQTYDLTSYIPDSASTATALATGNKTSTGTVGMDVTGKIKYETIAEHLKQKYGYKVGIISSVNINHTTPAAFYAHQPSRKNYYNIGLDLIESGFDYFAGGAFIEPKGKDNKKPDLYKIAKKMGYRMYTEPVTVTKEKCIVIPNHLDEKGAFPYRLDAKQNDYDLCEYVKNGIECMNNDRGFFMMVEGGKIDWACHSNDPGSCIREVISFHKAVNEVLKFYIEHKEETLILVTADHETGGLALGYTGTGYQLYLDRLEHQKISCDRFKKDYVAKYREEQTTFEDAMKDVEVQFGLCMEKKEGKEGLVLTYEEMEELKKAYELSMTCGARKQSKMKAEEYMMYGTNEPFVQVIARILSHKAGVDFSTYCHTGASVPIYAIGCGAEKFSGNMDNTEVYERVIGLMKGGEEE